MILRIRTISLDKRYIQSEEFPFAVQISQDNLVWITVKTFKSGEDAIGWSKDLELSVKQNFLSKPTHILWSTKL